MPARTISLVIATASAGIAKTGSLPTVVIVSGRRRASRAIVEIARPMLIRSRAAIARAACSTSSSMSTVVRTATSYHHNTRCRASNAPWPDASTTTSKTCPHPLERNGNICERMQTANLDSSASPAHRPEPTPCPSGTWCPPPHLRAVLPRTMRLPRQPAWLTEVAVTTPIVSTKPQGDSLWALTSHTDRGVRSLRISVQSGVR